MGNSVREEGRLAADLRVAIEAHHRAVEYCRASTEFDKDWFTLDVQDGHRRRAAILEELLQALEDDPMPYNDHETLADPIRGAVFSSYAIAAQATTLAMQDIQQDGEAASAAAASAASGFAATARSAGDNLRRSLATGVGGEEADDDVSFMGRASAVRSSAASSSGYAPAADLTVAEFVSDSAASGSTASASSASSSAAGVAHTSAPPPASSDRASSSTALAGTVASAAPPLSGLPSSGSAAPALD